MSHRSKLGFQIVIFKPFIVFGVHFEDSEDYSTSTYELVFHFAEETNGDFDRLQPGGVVLIEMDIRLLLTWYFSCLPSNRSRPTLCSRCSNNNNNNDINAPYWLCGLEIFGENITASVKHRRNESNLNI